MAGRIIQLTPARRIIEPPFIDTSIRADIGDYGPPGVHLHGPLALKGRGKAASLGIPGAMDDADGVSAVDECAGFGGFVVGNTVSVAAGATVAFAHGPIPFPFSIVSIQWVSENPFSAIGSTLILISEDNSTTLGTLETGEGFGLPTERRPLLASTTQQRTIFPPYVQRNSPRFIKIIFVNPDVAARIFDVDISGKRLG